MAEAKDITKADIVSALAKERFIETTVENIARRTLSSDPTLQDIAQDLYIDLLNKDEEKVVGMYNRKELKFFVTRTVINTINSKNGRYYYDYKRYEDHDDITKMNV